MEFEKDIIRFLLSIVDTYHDEASIMREVSKQYKNNEELIEYCEELLFCDLPEQEYIKVRYFLDTRGENLIKEKGSF